MLVADVALNSIDVVEFPGDVLLDAIHPCPGRRMENERSGDSEIIVI